MMRIIILNSIDKLKIKNKVNVAKIFSYFFPFLLIFTQYKYYSINIGLLILYFLTSILFFQKQILKIQPLFLLFNLSVFTLVIIDILFYESMFHASWPYYFSGLLLLFSIFISSQSLDYSSIFKMYKLLGLVATYIIIFQGIELYLFSINIAPINILPLPTNTAYLWVYSSRPSGLFTEPQLYSTFVLPLFLHSLLMRNWRISLILLFGILISGSTYGVLISITLILWTRIQIKDILSIRFLLVVFTGVSIIILILFNSSLLNTMTDKLLNTNLMEDIRVGKAIYLVKEMSFSELLIGVDSTIEEMVSENINNFPWMYRYIENSSRLLYYLSGFFGLLLHYGIVPFGIFIILLVTIYFKGNIYQRGMALIIFMHSLSATILFNGYYVFLFTLLFLDTPFGLSKIKFMKIKFKD